MANQKAGVVIAIEQPHTITASSGKQYAKRGLYVDCTPYSPLTGERSEFENKIMFDFIGDKVSLLDNVQPGQVVIVTFDIQGSEVKGQDGKVKYFTHVRPYKLEVRQVQQPTPQPMQQPQPQPAAPQGGYAQQPAPQYQPQQAQQLPPQANSDMPF